jgi:hypothetical protein
MAFVPTLYQDSLIEITEKALKLRRYYFPFGRDRTVPFEDFKKIEVISPSVLRGSWRIWGSGDFKTWFPLDWKRPSRDRLFIGSLRGQTSRIGFTAENGAEVQKLLATKCSVLTNG